MSAYTCVYVDHILHKKKKIMYETYDHLTYRELMNDACDGPTLDPKRANT